MADTTIKYVSSQNLSYYDGRIKTYLETKDAALKAQLEEQLGIVAGSLDAEIARAKAAEEANKKLAEDAQTSADQAQSKGEEALAHSEALAAKVGTVPTDKTVMGIIQGIQESAYNDTELRGLITGLTNDKADKTQVAKDIADAVKAEEDARKEAVSGVQGAVDALTTTVGNNKTAIEGTVATLEAKVDANETDIEDKMTALTARVEANETAVKTTLPNAIATEKARAEEVEADHEERLVKVETFFEKAEDETINEALDTLVEIQKYLDGEGAVADQMLLDIAANAKAISDHAATDHDFGAADEALKDELTAEIDKKADSSTVSAMDTAYKAADTALSGRLDVLEAINHEAYIAADTALKNELNGAIALKADQTTVDGLLADRHTHANKALLDTYTQTEANLADAVAKKHDHANAEELAKIANGDVAKWNAAEQNAKTHADNLNTAMTTRVDGIVADVALKATQADLTALTTRVGAEETKSANFESRIAANEAFIAGIEFMTTGDIDGLFA